MSTLCPAMASKKVLPPTPSIVDTKSRQRISKCHSNKGLSVIPIAGEDATNVNTLDLSFNEIEEISNLEDYRELRFLDLGCNNIQRVHGLSRSIKLDVLYMNDNKLTELVGLGRLKNLRKIRFHYNKINRVADLPRSLTSIDVSCNLISSLDAFRRLSSLVWFSANSNKITDITALSQCRNLQDLQLEKNRIPSVICLSSLTNLLTLNLGSNCLTSVEDLPLLPSLQELILSNNAFQDLNGISSKVPSLILLDLSNNKISDCTLLADLGALEQFSELMIEGNPCAKTGYREEVKQLLTGLLTLDHDLIELEALQESSRSEGSIDDAVVGVGAEISGKDLQSCLSSDSDEEHMLVPQKTKKDPAVVLNRCAEARKQIERTLSETQQLLTSCKTNVRGLVDSSQAAVNRVILSMGGELVPNNDGISKEGNSSSRPNSGRKINQVEKDTDSIKGTAQQKQNAPTRARSADTKTTRLNNALRFSQVYADAAKTLKRVKNRSRVKIKH